MAVIFKPYNFLILVATLFFIASFFVTRKTIEVNLSDSYYIIGFIQFLRMVAVVLFIFSAFYKLLKRYLNLLILSYLHIVIMLIAIGIFIFITDPFGKALNWITLIFILSQILFLTNICFGILKK
ncbi:hypothetical protein [Pedobacter rhodius]|uniref:Uncharacterized protein n=1 Tax=Pedobacter rhodius TaxID=3004098 RepID=A0ABT4KX23_9SPHI|nr:hypothetical protein [Pedobacter sp. SJ11]MCZ4222418.1 hypothetical protein [Pedobacter sp. SJ11]